MACPCLLNRTDFGVAITASMTTGDSCSMIVKIDSSGFDENADAYLSYGCSYRPVCTCSYKLQPGLMRSFLNKTTLFSHIMLQFDGDYCWRECHDVPPLGYCWLSQTCSDDDQCAAYGDPDVYPCDSECIEIVV